MCPIGVEMKASSYPLSKRITASPYVEHGVGQMATKFRKKHLSPCKVRRLIRRLQARRNVISMVEPIQDLNEALKRKRIIKILTKHSAEEVTNYVCKGTEEVPSS